MNMWSTGLVYFLLNPFTDWLTNKPKNLVEIIPSEDSICRHGHPIVENNRLSLKPKFKCISYDPIQLKQIWCNLQHDHRPRQSPFGAIQQIRKFRLNNKFKNKKVKNRQIPKQNSINFNNLTRVNRNGYKMTNNLIFSTCNIQSIRSKELQVSQLISDYSLDFMVMTETWFTDKQQHWKDSTTLNNNNLTMHIMDRSGRPGGGLALIHQSKYPCTSIQSGTKPSFEYAIWELRTKSETLTIHGIYHPLYSLKNKITNTMFIDDFMDYVSTTMPVYHNNLFLGDFNLHVSNTDDTDSAIFNDSIDAMGLYQNVGFSTHKSGNILDLILSDITDNTKILTAALGPYLMDHRVVIATLNVKTLIQKPKVRTIRKLDKVADIEWTGEFNPNNVPLTYKLDNLVESQDTELTHILDKLAPEKKYKISTKPKQP